MIAFSVPEWLQEWAERNGIAWTLWDYTEALYWEQKIGYRLGLV